MLVMGVDPGTARTGYGLVRSVGSRLDAVTHGVVETPAGLPTAERLSIIYRNLLALVEEYRPQVVAMEQVFFGRNARSAMAVGQARGVAMLAAAAGGARVVEYAPFEVKQAVAGYGAADKAQVQFMVRALLGMREVPAPADAADALAAAICCLHRWQGEEVTGR